MSKVRIAVQIPPEHADYSNMIEALDRAEEMGVDIAYTWDHFFPLRGNREGRHFECWTILAAWAERTDRILLGPLVTANSYRNPQLLADMARTVDHISQGRVILGIGSGWFERDYDEYGYEFGTAGSRLRDLEEALPRIQHRLARLNPPPIGAMPIMIGGGGEKVTLRLVAEYADIWHGFGSHDTIRHKCDVLDRWCAEVGRDPAEIERSTGARAVPRTDDFDGFADEYYDIGIRQLTINLHGPEFKFDGVARWLEWRDRKNASK